MLEYDNNPKQGRNQSSSLDGATINVKSNLKEIAEALKGSQVSFGLTAEGYKFTVTQTGYELSNNPSPIPTSGRAIGYTVSDTDAVEMVTVINKGTVSNYSLAGAPLDVQKTVTRDA